jgi:3-methyl-2-oxobutanoate hydroxymethyltransferase
VQVYHDLLGLGGDFTPRHAKRFAEIGAAVREAVSAYGDEVRSGTFPGGEQTTHMDARELEGLEEVRVKRVRRA